MDCGANPNLLSVKVYENLGEDRPVLQPVVTKLTAANGQQIITHGHTNLHIQVDGATFDGPVIVADLDNSQGILGMRFLRDNDCTIAFRSGVLQCGQKCWDLAGPDKEWGLPARLVNKVTIPAGHELVTAVAVDKVTDSPVDCISDRGWLLVPQVAVLGQLSKPNRSCDSH